MNRYKEFTLATMKKWDLVRYIYSLYETIDQALKLNKDMKEHLNKEFWLGKLELQEQILKGDNNKK